MGNDTLLHFLTAKGSLTSHEFGNAFQILHDARRRASGRGYDLPQTADRRASMRLFGQLGYADYDAGLGQLRIQPSGLILLPVLFGQGRRMLLTGARTPSLLNLIRKAAALLDIRTTVQGQHYTNVHLLLPDRVELSAEGSPAEGFGLEKLKRLASECGLLFCDDLVQSELLDLSVQLEEYRSSLQPYTDELPDDWKQSWFDPVTLKWILGPGDKKLSLSEFEFTVYRRQCYLWQEGIPYMVDKSWGRYIMLSRANAGVPTRVLLHSRSQEILAVPATAPLPELPARAAALLSGLAPEQCLLTYEGRTRRYNVYQAPGAYTLLYRQ